MAQGRNLIWRCYAIIYAKPGTLIKGAPRVRSPEGTWSEAAAWLNRNQHPNRQHSEIKHVKSYEQQPME